MKLSHLDQAGRARMVDVGDKPLMDRTAVATGTIRMSREAFQQVAEVSADLVEGPGEHGEGLVQLASHGGALAPLAGEHERHAAVWRSTGAAGHHVDGRLAAGQGVQAGQERTAVTGDDRGPVLECGPRGGQRVPDVGRGEPGP